MMGRAWAADRRADARRPVESAGEGEGRGKGRSKGRSKSGGSARGAWATVALLALLAPAAAGAADLSSPSSEPPPAASPWQFQMTFYGWATSVNGDMGIRRLPTFPVDVPFRDVVSHLDGALMGTFLAKNGDWTLFTDVVWSRLSADSTLNRPALPQVSVTEKLLIINAEAGYRLPVGGPGFDLSATAGLRYQRLTLDAELSSPLSPFSYGESDVKQWVDPVFGLLLQYQINEKWFLNAQADVGGFGVGSKLTAQGFIAVGYNWTKAWSTAIGYRALYTDYEDVSGPTSDFRYTTTMHGPMLSLAYHF